MVWIRVLTEVCRWEIRNPGNVHGVPNCPPTPEPAEVIPNLIYLISELQRAPAQKIMKHISLEAPVAYGSYYHGSFMRTSHLLERGRFQLLRPEMSSRKWLAFLFIPLEGPARPTVLCFHLDLLKFPH